MILPSNESRSDRNGNPPACTLDLGQTTHVSRFLMEPKKLHCPPGQIPPTLEMIQQSGLLQSLTDQDQQVDVIAYTSPELQPDEAYTADGNCRVLGLQALGKQVWVRLLDHCPKNGELRRIRTATNFTGKDKNAAQAQLAADLWDEIQETGHTQAQAAADLGISAGYASKVLAPVKKLCPDLQDLPKRKDFCWDVVRIIATMPSVELQKKLAAEAIATHEAGHKVKRDTLERREAELKAEMNGGKKPKKQKPLKGTHKGVGLSFPAGCGWELVKEVAAFLAGLAQRGEKGDLPPTVLLSSTLKA